MGIKEEEQNVLAAPSGVSKKLDFSSVENRQAAVQGMFQAVSEKLAEEEECNFVSNEKQWELARWLVGQFFELNHFELAERILRDSKKRTFSTTTFDYSDLKPVELDSQHQEFYLSAQEASPRGKFASVLQQALQECFADKALVVGLNIRSDTVGDVLRLHFAFKLFWGRSVTEAPPVGPQVSTDSNNLDLFAAARRLRDGSGWEHGSLFEYVSKVFPSDSAIQMAIFEAAKASRDYTTIDLVSETYNNTCTYFIQLLGSATVNAAMTQELTRRFPNFVFHDVSLDADERYIPCRLRLRATISWE